jgi:hypothetical protein
MSTSKRYARIKGRATERNGLNTLRLSSYFHAIAAMRYRDDREVDLESLARPVRPDELPRLEITRVKRVPTAPRPSRRVYGQIALTEIGRMRWAEDVPRALEIVAELAGDVAFVAEFKTRLGETSNFLHTILTGDRDPFAYLADRVMELLVERARCPELAVTFTPDRP